MPTVDPLAEARRRRKEARAPKVLGYSAPPPSLAWLPPIPPPISTLPPCVTYVPGFISAEDEECLLQHVRQAPQARWSGVEGDGRRTQNYGGAPGSLAIAEGLPEWLAPLVRAVVESGAWGDAPPPNHVLVNIFRPGTGLVPHTDGPLYAGPRVATLSLGSDVFLDLHEPHAATPHASLLLRRRSLNVISAEAYAQFHGIAEREADVVDERVANAEAAEATLGEQVPRGPRVSIVFVSKLEEGSAATHPSVLELTEEVARPDARSDVAAVAAVARRVLGGSAAGDGDGDGDEALLEALPRVCGRISRAADEAGFATLSPDGVELKPVVFAMGSDGLHMLLGSDMPLAERLRRLGFDDMWVRQKLRQKLRFRLALFPARRARPATWKGVFALVDTHYPQVAAKVRAQEAALCSTSFAELEASFGASYFDLNEAAVGRSSDDPRYLTTERLAAAGCAGTAAEVRGWLYFTLGLSRLFDGSGRTRPPDAEGGRGAEVGTERPAEARGVREYLVENQAVAELEACEWVELALSDADFAP